MALKLTRDLIFFDLETTGVDVERDRIVSLGMLRMGGNGFRGPATERLFNPGVPIPAQASAIHGIFDADVAHEPSFASGAAAIVAELAGCDVAGFNVRNFDVPMLSAEFRRAGITWPGPDVVIVDAFRIYNRKEPRTLEAAARHYLGEEHHDAHNATADVIACARVLIEQAGRYGAPTLAELVALERDPEWVDSDGKIRWQGTVPVIGFGKWAGRPLAQVDAGYLDWMLGQNFPADTKAIIRDALRGVYPIRSAA